MPSSDLPTWAASLDLRPHPEGGWYAETYRNPAPTGTTAGVRSLATAIHFLLLPGESSAWHRVASDELWFHHRGGALRLWLGGDADRPVEATELLLGPDVEAGERPQLLVPAGHWQAARPVDEAVLVSCVVVPGFDFEDFTLDRDVPLPG
ncbi:cupin domain-containing protein [Nocardioides pocheonensis]|uniref:Cupin domain-containing protein n=1 Tax=Nocardioides pocheonensis TaxID=661485 RepID=A0A3N0GKK9_9ACTN|nr:cupin domain-containing protein [Nocardioides pocheonensis]RNM12600.1 cupin domain-containing protein [Nocardioides pocheonensis]